METCECRTFAIGRCAQCQAPVCLHHSRLVDGRCHCLAHYDEIVAAQNARASLAAEPAPPDPAAPGPERRRGRRSWGGRR